MLSARRVRVVSFLTSGGAVTATMRLASSNLAARAIGMAAALVGAATLGIGQYGRFSFISASASLLGAIGILGIGPLATRRVAASTKDPTEARTAANAALTVGTTSVLLGNVFYLIAAISSRDFQTALGLRDVGDAICITTWSIVGNIFPLLTDVVAGHQNFRLVAWLNVLRAGLVGGSTITFAIATHTAVGAVFGSVIGEVLALSIALTLELRFGYIGLVPLQRWKQQVSVFTRGALALGSASILIQASTWGGQRLLLSVTNGIEQNGAFALASRLMLAVTLLPNAIATVALPRLTSLETSSRPTQSRRVLVVAIATATLAACCLVLGLHIWFGLKPGGFARYESTFIAMAMVGVVAAANNVTGVVALASDRVRLWIMSDVLMACVAISGAFVAVPHSGSFGLSIAVGVAYAVSALFLYPAFRLRGVPSE